MSEPQDSSKDAALDAFLGLVADKGYAAVSLRDVAIAAGLGFADLYRLYPDKLALVKAFVARIDREVLAGTSPALDPEETVRDRLFDVMMRRFDALKPHRAIVASLRRAASRDPVLALALAPATRRSMALMLEAAGAASDGLAGAVRQRGLLAIYGTVWRVFDRDDSADLGKTMAALDGRLKTAERWAQVFERYAQRPRRGEPEPKPEPEVNSPEA
ncbi:MAG: TetR/AcrR family transcriptional regulator [Alphaproteobacteria bacterium]|nr:TetR/AcrR family transcriptional regulator [Alphaproteobacteria bacterium]